MKLRTELKTTYNEIQRMAVNDSYSFELWVDRIKNLIEQYDFSKKDKQYNFKIIRILPTAIIQVETDKVDNINDLNLSLLTYIDLVNYNLGKQLICHIPYTVEGETVFNGKYFLIPYDTTGINLTLNKLMFEIDTPDIKEIEWESK